MQIANIIEIAKLFLPIFIQLNKKELGNRKGIVFAIQKRSKTGKSVYLQKEIPTIVLGDLPEEKVKEKTEFAIEKIRRLIYFQTYKNSSSGGDVSSFESEDVPNKKFGGSIRTDNYFMSASGFPPHLDQKFLLELAIMTDQLSFYSAAQIDLVTWSEQKKWKKIS